MEEQFGDERVVPFSFSTDPESVQIDQESCWLTYTNEETHKNHPRKSQPVAALFRHDRGNWSAVLSFD